MEVPEAGDHGGSVHRDSLLLTLLLQLPRHQHTVPPTPPCCQVVALQVITHMKGLRGPDVRGSVCQGLLEDPWVRLGHSGSIGGEHKVKVVPHPQVHQDAVQSLIRVGEGAQQHPTTLDVL